MRFLPFLFSIVLFFSAFLSFSIQPVLGKMLLPMVGGAPSGWIVAMAFFQLALLGGYGVSWLLGRFSPWVHAIGLIVLYALGSLVLPPHLPVIADTGNLSWAVIKALAATILMPFVALTATTAALQRVFAATSHPTAKDPYYLFVASNVGSFMGLLIYPFILEPYTSLNWQAGYWQLIYILTVALIVVVCSLAWRYRHKAVTIEAKIASDKIPFKKILYWLVLAFIPCSLSMGVTTLITTDIGGLPLFWVLPLALYLLTFILAFARKPLLSLSQLTSFHGVAGVFMIAALGLGMKYQSGGNLILFLLLGGLLLAIFFMIAWSCHRHLAQDRPQTEHLTLYYFVIATGGALAGLCHAFIVPFVLQDVIEFPLMVIASLWLLKQSPIAGKSFKRFLAAAWVIGIVAIAVITGLKYHGYPEAYYAWFYPVFLFCIFFLSLRPRLLVLLGFVVLYANIITHYPGEVLIKERNFFGQHAVIDEQADGKTLRLLIHGNILHGMEVVKNGDEKLRYQYGYYARGNPIHDVLLAAHAKTLAVIGLGSGQMACYDPALKTDFYEIDSDVIKVAQNFFSYLKTCPPRNIFLGDGRKMLTERREKYDVIMLDAFSSDGIPLHLVTREALRLYKEHLTKGGIILFHVSNRYLKLNTPLANVAQAEGLQAYDKLYKPDSSNPMNYMSAWVAFPTGTGQGDILKSAHWHMTDATDGTPWSDQQSSLLSALIWYVKP